MKTQLRILTAIGCIALIGPVAQAQIASRIDQYMHDPAIINPAAINTYSNARASLFYNKLYSNVNGSPGNLLMSLSAPIADRRIGLGGFFAQEKIGFTTLTNLYGTYAYTIPLGNKQRLNVAASLGMINQKFNGGVIDVVDPNDPVYQNYLRGQSTSRLDIKFSALYQLPGLMLGFSTGRLTNPRFVYENASYSSTYTLRSISNAYAAGKIQVSNDLMIQPVASATFTDYELDVIQYGANFWILNSAWVGVHHSGHKNLSLQLGAQIKKTLVAGYSYSMPMANNSRMLGAGHEIYLSFLFGQTHRENLRMDRLVLGGDDPADNLVASKPAPKPRDTESKPANRVESRSGRVTEPVTIANFQEMKTLRNNQDTAHLHLAAIPQEKPETGYYICAGMNRSEAQIDNMIKSLYMKGVRSYKFYNPKNGYYYVYLSRKSSKTEADAVKFEGVPGVDNLWTTEIQ